MTLFNRSFAAILFDMDGTLINSIAAAERIWGAWAQRHGLDVAHFLPTIHGRRVADTIAGTGLVGIDIERESAAITAAELRDTDGVVEIPGAAAFLRSIPADRHALVTSAPRALAIRRLQAAGMPIPSLIVSAEDVTRGKPAPDGYGLAAKRLDVAPEDCLVVEDTLAGIRAGEAAGASVLVITDTHHEPMSTTHVARRDYVSLQVGIGHDGRVELRDLAASTPTTMNATSTTP